MKKKFLSLTFLAMTFAFAATAQDSGKMTDDRDGRTYNTVKIGKQIWLAENLNFETSSSTCYDNSSSNCDKYGRLYVWKDVMGGKQSSNREPSGIQGPCPNGWHVPSGSEWQSLMEHLETSSKMLTSTGFMPLSGGGYATEDNEFFSKGESAFFWSATESEGAKAWSRVVDEGKTAVESYGNDKTYGFSCRCVQD